MPTARRGAMLPFAIVMMAVILTIVIGTMSWFNSQLRRQQEDRWRAIAADAAQSGMSMMLAWAKAHVDRTRTTPPEWDVADGAIANPLKSLFESPDFVEELPPGALTGRHQLTIGSRNTPVETGDIIDPDNAGEYVVGRYGDYVASFRVRLQPFRLAENAPRQYKIACAGRVRVYDGRVTEGGPFRGSRLVADRVLVATVGKQPLSRFAALIDVDLVSNWVPGETVEGPVHVNRGYIDEPPGRRPGNTNLDNGRSFMKINAPGEFGIGPDGSRNPQFFDAVTLTARPDDPTFPDRADFANVVQVDKKPLSDASYSATLAREIFRAPENQAKLDGKAAPMFIRDKVELPPNSRARLPAALGIPEARSLASIDGFARWGDGVYLPTKGMTEDGQKKYGSGRAYPAGGIYVRGQVELMRMAVEAERSYYFFQLGYVAAGAPRRCYMVEANRATKVCRVVAFAPGVKLRDILASGQLPPPAAAGAVAEDDPRAYGVMRLGTIAHTFQPTAGEFPFNGIVFVDYSLHDPIRAADNPLQLRQPGNGDVVPLTGQILALGDPGSNANPNLKQAFEGQTDARLPTNMDGPEVVCTETVVAAGTPKASKLMIVAAGDIFIQNHVLLRSVVESCGLQDGLDRLRRDNVRLSQTRDMLGIVSDKQILIGLAAPTDTTRGNPGVVITGALAALGDPAFDYRSNTTQAIPPAGSMEERAFRFRGSFATESLIPALATGQRERYDILFPSAGQIGELLTAVGAGTLDTFRFDKDATWPVANYPFNPIYTADGPFGPLGQLPLENRNPNVRGARGNLTVFGSIVTKKRGSVGIGNRSYDKDFRYDQRLLTNAPPLFPNSINIVTSLQRLSALGKPPYAGPGAEEAEILND